jgi:hypothetical protein
VRSRVRTSVAAALLAVTVSSCGESTPEQDVPQLASLLDRVDSALTDSDFSQARAALRSLVRVTSDARDAGDLDDAEAADILAAAGTLLSRLPEPTPPPPTPAPDEKGDDEKDEDEKDEEKKDEEKKDEEDGGNGDSSDNGPDDGHGN